MVCALSLKALKKEFLSSAKYLHLSCYPPGVVSENGLAICNGDGGFPRTARITAHTSRIAHASRGPCRNMTLLMLGSQSTVWSLML